MKIGNLQIDNITVLAPLAGITNLPFRRMVRDIGCGLVSSEMVSASGLVYGSGKSRDMLETDVDEKPVSFQIFGADPDIMAAAAAMVEAAGADIVDINCGCSVKKILKSGAGSALMKKPETVRAIFEKVRKAIRIPLTIKIRSGWEPSGNDAFLLAKIAEDCGVDAITLHPRTATQGFSGTSDWSLIARLKKAISIPVIGNGDITRPEDAVRMMAETNCDGVMAGRAAMGNPWIFFQIHELLATGSYAAVSIDQRFAAMKQFTAASVAYFGELTACRMMRSRLPWLIKGLPGASKFRESITRIRTLEEAEQLMDAYLASLIKNGQD